MKERLTIQIGGFGNRLGHQLFSDIYNDFETTKDQTYFNMGDRNNFARSILVDLETNVIDQIQSDPRGLYNPDNFVCASSCTKRNWESCYNVYGPQMTHLFNDALSSELEKCDSLEAFQVIFATSGGTGSGLSCQILEDLYDFGKRTVLSMCQVHSPDSYIQTSLNGPLSSLNTLLSLRTIQENSDGICIFDEKALFSLCKNVLKLTNHTFVDENNLINMILKSMAYCTFYSDSSLSQAFTIRKMLQNLISFPKCNFFAPMFPNLVKTDSLPYVKKSVEQVISTLETMYQPNSWGLSVDSGCGVLNVASFFTSGIDLSEIHLSKQVHNKVRNDEPAFSFYSCKHPLKSEVEQDIVCLVDSTEIQNPLNHILREFEPYRDFKQIPFAHHFLEAGFEEMIYFEEISNLHEMAISYGFREE